MANVTYQIWANFSKCGDRSTPTTTSCFMSGQLMGDGLTTMVDFNRKFAEDDGDTFELMSEFEVPSIRHLEENDWAIVRAMDAMFWQGWFKAREEDDDE